MAREGDRRGSGAPRRSPQELVETLASLAASTPEPPPRPRRRGPKTNQSAPVTTRSEPAETPPRQVTLTPEPEAQAPDVAPRTPAPAADPPAPPANLPAPDRPAANGLAAGAPLGEGQAPHPNGAARPSEVKRRVSNRTRARPRLHGRARGRVWHRKRRSPSQGVLRIGSWRRSRTTRRASNRARGGSRNVRRLYPPLLILLLIVIVVGLANRGGGGSANPPAQTASGPPSVFPAPSTVPTPTPPPVVTPAPTAQQPSVATQPEPCRPLQVNGRAVIVSVLQGQVTCRSARAVLLAFESGKGRRGGSAGKRYVRIRGWRCVPSGICTRPGKSIKAS